MRTDDCYAIAYKTTRLAAACVIAGSLLPGMPTQVQAAFYKCVSADGSTTYNDTPCAANESTHQLNRNAREIARLDCRIAHNFAYDAVARMRHGDTVSEVIQAYSGADNYSGADKLSEGARNLINYVYSFKNTTVTSAQRIVELTTQRCEAGLLGNRLDQCESFPSEFIERFGGCVDARQTDQTIIVQPHSDDAASLSNATPNATPSANSASGVARFSQRPPTLNAANPVTGGSVPFTERDYDDMPPSERSPHPE